MSNDDHIRATVRELVAGARGHSAAGAQADSAPLMDGDHALDSVQVMELITALEDSLGFAFDDADLSPSTFRSVDSLVAVISRLKDESP